MTPKKICISINLDWPLKRYHELYSGVQMFAEEKDWILVWDHFPELLLKQSQKDKPAYDGVIGRIKFPAYEEINRLGIPAVNTWYNSQIKTIPSIFNDYKSSGKILAQHLIHRGYRNFVNIDFRNNMTSNDFFDGLKEVLKSHTCTVKRHLISHSYAESQIQWSKLREQFSEWCKSWTYPLALVGTMSSLAPAFITLCNERGLRIPDDIAIAVTGNEGAYCQSLTPHVTAVEYDYIKLGYEAARLLDKQFEGEPTETVFIEPVRLIARESTDSFVVGDKAVKEALRYIADNSHKNLEVRDIVDQTDVSRRTLERRFFKEVGHTIQDEINRLRVITLKRLLADSDKKFKDLSVEAGFSSPLNMRRIFKRLTGMTPGEYKKSLTAAQ